MIAIDGKIVWSIVVAVFLIGLYLHTHRADLRSVSAGDVALVAA